jgi:pyruvate formate lyase activating enzyme
MQETDYLKDLEKCELCEHRCRVNRLAGETGVCKVTMPVVASATLHPAPPESYTVFMAGCNFKCLNCQNWTISQYPDNRCQQRGFTAPKSLAEECITYLNSFSGRRMGADRIFFSGGEPTIHLPYIEKVLEEARKIKPDTKVNFDTNGFMTEKSLHRILDFTTSITYDLKAFHNEVHLALTGASLKPVLRNAEYIAIHAKQKLWEFRIVVIPKINEHEIRPLVEFLAAIDSTLPVCFLAFRPNFALENHPGANKKIMDECVDIAKAAGLKNACWAGQAGISGTIVGIDLEAKQFYSLPEAQLGGTYALYAGCKSQARNCSICTSNQTCQVKKFIPKTVT